MSANKQLVYVVHEFPVATQTFVENEARALDELGHPVLRYAIHHKKVNEPLSPFIMQPLDAVTSFHGIRAVARVLLTCLRKYRSIGRILFSEKFNFRDFVGQVFALIHAVGLTSQLYRRGFNSVHFHGHFLGRCLDVVSYARVLFGATASSSATAHAADANNRRTPSRFRLQVHDLTHVFCASKSVADVLQQSSDRRASAIVHCGITPQRADSSADASAVAEPRLLKLLTVARLVEKKGLSDCLAAAEQLQMQGIEFEWRFIGDGPLGKSLQDDSRRLVDQGHVSWMGAQPSRVVYEHLTSWADAFILPCKLSSDGDVDGIPVALMEAMTSKVAVVSSRISGIPELISHNRTGLLITPGDVPGLVASIASLRDFDFRDRLVNAAKSFVDSEFNQVVEARKIRDLILSP